MPQYQFYFVPENARRMTFGEIFLDCYEQLRGALQPMQILLTDGTPLEFPIMLRHGERFPPAPDIPEPVFLGDFLKLFDGPAMSREIGVLSNVPAEAKFAQAASERS